ncbi:Protein Lines, N-terminal,Armadillo-like helical,Protein Lines, C-terminal [Cinara cedri]|uniref:Protein Lines, N-terminal,Armadillo-like helical,Protein Lines, C-terminal n=1 Tax=Cinara cedri TaxID=506608 RepID=A0A5E4MPJ7_9HEMI|nr:Protein Lines, N-terminal,Armadillo-like helical,Protein Lines, C-terminal [Cinara cedri]
MEEQETMNKTLPLAKKQKINENEYRLVDLNVDTISLNLTKHCLCQLPETCMLKEVFRVKNVSSWTRERLLNFLSSARLTCDIALKQLSEGTICTSVERLSNYLIANKTGIVNEIVSLLTRTDPYISYAASNALAEIFVCSQNKLDNVWVVELTDLFLRRSPETLCPVIAVFKRVLCWRDAQMIDSEKNIKMPENCVSRKVIFEDEEIEMDDEFGISLVKTKVIEVLQTQWQMIVLKFIRYMSSFDHCTDLNNSDEPFNHKMGHLAIVEFIKLWTSMVSIKTNLNVMNIKYFYADLGQMLILLRRPKVQPVVWKNIINLFNESLCYTTTLAVQGTMQEEPCMLARELVKVVKTKNMLNNMPFRKGSGEYGGGEEDDGDKKLLQDTVLLILKAVATIIKETRNESSSSDSSADESEDSEEVDAEMAIIESSVNDVLRKLDSCVKKCMSYLPETPIAQWIVQLFSDRNDILIESMICTIDISLVLCYRRNSIPMLRHVLNPTASLVEFLQTLSYNNDNVNELILDLLLGSDTSFLLYIMRILKFIGNRWSEFCLCCDTKLQSTMTTLSNLQTSLDQLIKNDLTPYNLNPVLRLLVKCSTLYTGVEVINV